MKEFTRRTCGRPPCAARKAPLPLTLSFMLPLIMFLNLLPAPVLFPGSAALVAQENPEPAAPQDPPAAANTEKKKPAGTGESADSGATDQLSCSDADCIRLKVNPATIEAQLADLFARNAGKIMVDFGDYVLQPDDKRLAPLRTYFNQIARRDGRVIIEPFYIGTRMLPVSPLAVKDLMFVSYDVFSRIKNKIKYRHLGNYHAKLLYHPEKKYVMYAYFIHRNYGDICITLKSRCDVIEYRDNETFDLTLSRRLELARQTGRPLRVLFDREAARLPEARIELEHLKTMNQSLRIHKWMLAAGQVKKRSLVRQRFIAIPTALTLIDYSLKAYDFIQSLALYRPATTMRAEVLYSGPPQGGKIDLIIFTPVRLKTARARSCLFF